MPPKRRTSTENAPNTPPFLKWPGGKRWFVSHHLDVFPKNYNRYIEAFTGSASVFFALRPKNAILCDSNEELMATYRAVKSRSGKVVAALKLHADKHSDTYYYKVRDEAPKDAIARAARLIYLNRTCFNGIYRVNRKGQFNVPRGSKDAVLMESDDFSSIASALRKAQLIAGDFSAAIDQATEGDLVFADPPYTVRHNNNGFLNYNEKIFSWSDQIRLADCLARAMERGAFVVSTNANHDSVRELYTERGFRCRTTSRFSAISGTGKDRGQYEELIITNPL